MLHLCICFQCLVYKAIQIALQLFYSQPPVKIQERVHSIWLSYVQKHQYFALNSQSCQSIPLSSICSLLVNLLHWSSLIQNNKCLLKVQKQHNFHISIPVVRSLKRRDQFLSEIQPDSTQSYYCSHGITLFFTKGPTTCPPQVSNFCFLSPSFLNSMVIFVTSQSIGTAPKFWKMITKAFTKATSH